MPDRCCTALRYLIHFCFLLSHLTHENSLGAYYMLSKFTCLLVLHSVWRDEETLVCSWIISSTPQKANHKKSSSCVRIWGSHAWLPWDLGGLPEEDQEGGLGVLVRL